MLRPYTYAKRIGSFKVEIGRDNIVKSITAMDGSRKSKLFIDGGCIQTHGKVVKGELSKYPAIYDSATQDMNVAN